MDTGHVRFSERVDTAPSLDTCQLEKVDTERVDTVSPLDTLDTCQLEPPLAQIASFGPSFLRQFVSICFPELDTRQSYTSELGI